MENLILIAIGLAAGSYLLYKGWRQLKGDGGCGCGSADCGKSKDCNCCK